MSARNPRASSLTTLSDCYRSRVDIWAWCEVDAYSCYRSDKLDLLALIAALGDLDLDQVTRRLTCKACGRRSQRIVLVHRGLPHQPLRDLPPMPDRCGARLLKALRLVPNRPAGPLDGRPALPRFGENDP